MLGSSVTIQDAEGRRFVSCALMPKGRGRLGKKDDGPRDPHPNPRLGSRSHTVEEWAVLDPLVPPPKPGGRPPTLDTREVMNGIAYVDRGGITWRYLPKHFPLEDRLPSLSYLA